MNKKISILVPNIYKQSDFKVSFSLLEIQKIGEKELNNCLDYNNPKYSVLILYFCISIINNNNLLNLIDRFLVSWNKLDLKDKNYFNTVIHTSIQDYYKSLKNLNVNNEKEIIEKQALLWENISRDLFLKIERIDYWIS